MIGKKYDGMGPDGSPPKDRWDLIPFRVLRLVVRVLTLGAIKYGDHNWRLVENGKERYFAAMMRHIDDYRDGKKVDPESGLNPLVHSIANAIFLLELEEERDDR